MKNSIFRYQLTQMNRPILFFIGLIGLSFGSLFWINFFAIETYIRYFSYYNEMFWIGQIVLFIIRFIVQLTLFALSLTIIIKCVKTREGKGQSGEIEYDPNHDSNTKKYYGTATLFGFRLLTPAIEVIFILSILGLIYWIPGLASNIFNLLYNFRYISPYNVASLLMLTINIETELGLIVILLISGIKSFKAKRREVPL